MLNLKVALLLFFLAPRDWIDRLGNGSLWGTQEAVGGGGGIAHKRGDECGLWPLSWCNAVLVQLIRRVTLSPLSIPPCGRDELHVDSILMIHKGQKATVQMNLAPTSFPQRNTNHTAYRSRETLLLPLVLPNP